jgi:hypothetical protein
MQAWIRHHVNLQQRLLFNYTYMAPSLSSSMDVKAKSLIKGERLVTENRGSTWPVSLASCASLFPTDKIDSQPKMYSATPRFDFASPSDFGCDSKWRQLQFC